jgi:PAS domain S-box-containing protein
MALKISEARHKQLIETASDAIYLIDENGTFIDTNRAAELMLKKSRVEIIGFDIGKVDPNFPVEDFKNFWEITPLFEQRIFETSHQDKDGRLIPVEVSGQKFNIENDIFFYGIARDITERKKAIMAIRESEAKFKGIFEHANIGIATASLKGPLTNVNPEFEKLLGYSRDELLKMSFRNFTHPDDIEREVELVTKMIKGEIDNYRIEKRYIHKNGSVVWIDLSIAGMKDDHGEYILFIGMANDITEKKKAQEKTEILAEMLDTAPNSIMIHDELGTILYANEKTYQMHGYTAEEYLQLNLHDIDTPENSELIKSRVDLIKENGSAVFEVEHLKKDGSSIPLEVYVKLVNWQGMPALLSIATDISERKRFISELVEAKEKAEESDRLKSAFLANMSHEIRTPMNSILGFVNLLSDTFYSNEEKNQFIELIKKSGERLISTINDLIDISRIEAGEVTIKTKPVNINEKIDDITELFINEAKEKGLYLIPTKTAGDSKVNIITDEDKLYSILINLVKNAIKYSRKGQIVIGYKLSKDFIEIFVSDTGIGIPKNRLDKIFDRFVQADLTYTRPFDGSGLGLAITKSYVEMLGGRIWVKSEEEKGSTFFFTLPNRQPEIIDDSPIVEKEGITGTEFKDLKILIADDEENVRYYFQQVLKNSVKEIIFAKTGKEALELYKNSGDIDLIFMDVKMPEMNGFDATREIRKFDSEIHIIAQTAFALEGDREKALEAGCNDYLAKPLSRDEIFEKMNIPNIRKSRVE